MFPKGSSVHDIVLSCYSDGYRCLHQIVMTSHPNYHTQPATLVKNYPKQKKDESIVKYHSIFLDYDQLKAYIINSKVTLEDE